MKKRNGYILGAPWSKSKRQAAIAEMRKDPINEQLSQLSTYLNRVTDKTGGVLALAALVFAISAFVLDKAGEELKTKTSIEIHTQAMAAGAFIFCALAIAILTLAIFALCTNLFTVWRLNWKPTEADMERIFHLFATRAIKLQISLYAIMIAAAFSFISLVFLETPMLNDAHDAIVRVLPGPVSIDLSGFTPK